MKRTFELGKIDFHHSGRKNCSTSVEIELRTTRLGELEFSACGDIWNTRHTNLISAGQNLDTIAEYVKTPLFKEIYDLWKHWHLNTMHAGTEKQEEALDAWHEKQKAEKPDAIILYDYRRDCEYLESIGLLFDEVNGKPYKYGCGWLTRIIPEEVLKRINHLLEEGTVLKNEI